MTKKHTYRDQILVDKIARSKTRLPNRIDEQEICHDWSVITFGDTSVEFHTFGFVEKVRSRSVSLVFISQKDKIGPKNSRF